MVGTSRMDVVVDRRGRHPRRVSLTARQARGVPTYLRHNDRPASIGSNARPLLRLRASWPGFSPSINSASWSCSIRFQPGALRGRELGQLPNDGIDTGDLVDGPLGAGSATAPQQLR
jgi:hypothetical protein